MRRSPEILWRLFGEAARTDDVQPLSAYGTNPNRSFGPKQHADSIGFLGVSITQGLTHMVTEPQGIAMGNKSCYLYFENADRLPLTGIENTGEVLAKIISGNRRK